MRMSDWSSDVCSSDLRGGCEFLDPCGLRMNPALEYSNLIEHREAFLAHQSRQIAVGRLQDCADATDVMDALRDIVPELRLGCPHGVPRQIGRALCRE